MNALRIAAGILGVAIITAVVPGCTFGLAHTRASTTTRLFYRSAAETGEPTGSGHDYRAAVFQTMRGTPEISAVLMLTTTGRHLEAVSPEGAFPKWNDHVIFYLQGPGTLEQFAGTTWQTYRMPATLRSEYDRYVSGVVRIARDHSEVMLEATPSARYSGPDYASFSGRWKIDLVEGARAPSN